MPSMYDDWSVADHLTNIKVVLRSILETGAFTPIDLIDAINQIDLVRQKLRLPAESSD